MDNKVILNDQEQARRNKLEKYRELGVDPFGKAYKVTHHVSDISSGCCHIYCNHIPALPFLIFYKVPSVRC